MINKILVPVDFSESARSALQFAVDVANHFNATLTLYHAWTPPMSDAVLSVDDQKEFFIQDKAQRVKLLESWCKEAGTSCTHIIDDDEPSAGILKHVASNNFQLVIMGTRGESVDRGLWVGSNASGVVEDSTIPVLAIPHYANYKGFKKVMIAVEDDETDLEAWEYLSAWLGLFKPKVTLVHISDDKQFNQERHWLKDLTERVNQRFMGMQADYRIYSNDTVTEGLNDAAHELSADLLVMFSEKKSFLSKLFGGSETKRMSAIMNTPLLAMPFD